MEKYYLLEWDTQFFGYKIANINSFKLELLELNAVLEELRNKDFKLAYCFVSPNDQISNNSLNLVSGLLVDEKITYFAEIGKENTLIDKGNIKPYDLKYASDKLRSLTLQSGIYSRFNIDPNFRNNEFEKLYLEWIEKSISRELANEVLVSCEENEIQGFVTLTIKNNNTGSIGLIAVDESTRGKSIGKKLMSASFEYFRGREINNLEVVTQKANYIACRFYESCGFQVKNIVNVYHLWIK